MAKKITPPSENTATLGAMKLPESVGYWPSNVQWAILVLVLTLASFFFEKVSPGFYQQDETGHFTSMLTIWHAPERILNNWAKPGYKVLYAIPALGGRYVVIFLTSLFAALAAFMAAKVAKQMGSKYGFLAFVLVATQPLWFELSFRNYSEIPSAFLLITALWAWNDKKEWLSALLVSYICTIRQEFIPLAGLLGLYALVSKRWLVAALLPVFIIGQHIWGWILFDNPTFLYDQIFGMTDSLANSYMRQGFWHYPKMSVVIFGPAALLMGVAFLAIVGMEKKEIPWLLIIPIVGYVLLNCIFNIQTDPNDLTKGYGPSTGGNLRYLLFISPLVAVAATLALDRLEASENPFQVAYVLIPLVIVAGIFLSYKHDYLKFTEERNMIPLVGMVFTLGLIAIPLKGNNRIFSLTGLLVLLALLQVKPKKLAEEDKTCKEVAEWYKENQSTFDSQPLIVEHPVFYYYLGRSKFDFPIEPADMLRTKIDSAKAGTLILWDSHYSYRGRYADKQYNINELLNRPQEFELVRQFVAPDQTFGIIALKKK